MEGKEEGGSAVAVADAPCSSQPCGVERRGGGVLVKSRCARCSRAAVLLVRCGIAGHHSTTAAFLGASYLKNTNKPPSYCPRALTPVRGAQISAVWLCPPRAHLKWASLDQPTERPGYAHITRARPTTA